MDPYAPGGDLDVASVLGDRTRRGIYMYVKHQREPVSVNQVADAFSMHRNAVKFHLDKLLEAGLLCADFRRINGKRGPGAGRPSKLYAASDVELSFSIPERHYELLAHLLLEALTSGRTLSEVGHAFGRQLAERSTDTGDKLERMSRILSELGFEPSIDVDGDGVAWITTENCPFARVAMQAPDAEVCALDHAIIRGILETFDGGEVQVREHMSMPHGHDVCVREVRFAI